MATYVMSDIHGMYQMFQLMLRKIRFSDVDELYILGDVIDFGPDGVKLIRKIMDMKNVHMLLGEHEWRMLTFYSTRDIVRRFTVFNDWTNAGGIETQSQMSSDNNPDVNRIIGWLRSCRTADQVTLRGRGFCMIHGWVSTDIAKSLTYRPALTEDPRLINGQTLIIGHTPVATWHYGGTQEGLRHYIEKMEASESHMRIEHAPHFIGIDCGAYWTQWTCAGCLACLRLDDMREFYVTRKEVLKNG